MHWLSGVLILLLTACAAPVSKPDALDRAASEARLPELVSSAGDHLLLSAPGPSWLTGVDPQASLTFARLETDPAGYVLLLQVDVPGDRLVVMPLAKGETPLDVLNSPARRRELAGVLKQAAGGDELPAARTLPLAELLQMKMLGSPLPQPKQIFAVAANYPSHLSHDLAFGLDAEDVRLLESSRPRVFLKYPPVAPPGQDLQIPADYASVQGPFATLVPPAQIELPGGRAVSSGHLDYEAEIAVVIGRRLTWEQARSMSDAELGRTVVAYLLFSDAKVRDPQVMNRIVRVLNDVEAPLENRYLVGTEALDATLGVWDEETCQWWSYAAGWGRYASAGPVLVAAPEDGSFPARLLLTGRSYASSRDRGVDLPAEVEAGPLYLRQAAVTSRDPEMADRLIWDVPAVIRSILNPEGNALAFDDKNPVIEAGDLISMGTPGGTVITSKPWWLLPLADNLVFWKDAEDFYRQFFAEAQGNYLYPGDRLLLWADGLGYQHLEVGSVRGMEGG